MRELGWPGDRRGKKKQKRRKKRWKVAVGRSREGPEKKEKLV
jgi:hypothetical protein